MTAVFTGTHDASDATWDAIHEGAWVISFACRWCGEWMPLRDMDRPCPGPVAS